jgi:pimeloyl-ACP methyl ester carboxylesterase
MSTVERQLIETRFGKMHVRTSGAGDTTPLVLLHSQFVAGPIYAAAIPVLAATRPVIVPDRIGHGDSDHWPEALDYADYAQATLEVLDALGVDSFDAVGFHSGCPEVLELAIAEPGRLRRAVLSGLWDYDEAEHAALSAHYVKPPPAPVPDGSHLLWHWQWWMDAKPEDVDLAWVQANTLEHLKAGPDYWRTFAAALDYPMADRIPRVTQPLLVLAAHDHSDDPMAAVAALLPAGTQVVDLPHITNAYGLFRTHLDEVTGLITDFLDAPAA